MKRLVWHQAEASPAAGLPHGAPLVQTSHMISCLAQYANTRANFTHPTIQPLRKLQPPGGLFGAQHAAHGACILSPRHDASQSKVQRSRVSQSWQDPGREFWRLKGGTSHTRRHARTDGQASSGSRFWVILLRLPSASRGPTSFPYGLAQRQLSCPFGWHGRGGRRGCGRSLPGGSQRVHPRGDGTQLAAGPAPRWGRCHGDK
jgi:hypothetical protein